MTEGSTLLSDQPGNCRKYAQLLQAGALSSVALVLVGIIAKLKLSDPVLDRRKDGGSKGASRSIHDADLLSFSTIKLSVARMLSMGLPFYASVQIGGLRTALVLLLTTSTGLCGPTASGQSLMKRWNARKLTCLVLASLILADFAGLMGTFETTDLAIGYVALLTSAFVIFPPVPHLRRFLGRYVRVTSAAATPTASAGPTPPATPRLSASPQSLGFISKSADANIHVIAGVGLAVATAVSSLLLAVPLNVSPTQLAYSTLTSACTAGMIFFSQAISIESVGKPGVAAGLLLTFFFGFIQHYDIHDSKMMPFIFGAFCFISYVVSLYDGRGIKPDFIQFPDSQRPAPVLRDHSMLTAYLLSFCPPGSILETILSERDSRRIAYFGW